MRILKALLKIAITLALVAIVFHAFEVEGVAAHVAQVDIATLVLATVMAWSLMLLHALRWLTVIRAGGASMGFGTALKVVVIGNFFNQVFVSSVGGDAVRIWCAWRSGLDLRAAAGTVLVEHVCVLLALLLFVAAGLPWLLEIVIDPVARQALLALIVAGLAGIAVLVALARPPRVVARSRVAGPVLALAALARTALLRARYALPILGLSTLNIIGFSAIAFVIASAMRIGITFSDCVLLVPPVVLISAIPVSVAGWGVREGAMVVALGLVGVPASAAFAVSVVFGLILAVASLPGILLFWQSGYSVRTIAAGAEALAARRPDRGA